MVLILATLTWRTQAACHTCHAILVPAQLRLARKVPHGLGFTAVQQLVERRPIVVASVLVAHRVWGSKVHTLLRSQEKGKNDDDAAATQDDDSQDDAVESEENNMSGAMIATIGVYKNFISPMLPPACRFLPTCSQYGVQAITEFGPSKGALLTAWRLLRCSPFGGKGYDPPKWPPVFYTYGSY